MFMMFIMISSPKYNLYLNVDDKISPGSTQTELYDKREEFSLPIANFPFLSSNLPAASA